MTPESDEAEFCAVPGSRDKERSIERIAAHLVLPTEAIARQVLDRMGPTDEFKGLLFLPMIVTNLDLRVCAFKAAGTDLKNDEINSAETKTVPYVRLRGRASQ